MSSSASRADAGPDWTRAWQPHIDAVGTEFGDPVALESPDAVELGAIRKFVEPIEFGCPLHHDAALAARLGFRGVPVPVSGIVPFTIQPVWRPGQRPAFVEGERNAQPARSGTKMRRTGLEPPTSAHFAADASADYLAPVVVGDRLYRRGNRLIACTPKHTRVGRGAFTTWESEIRNQRDEVVVRLRNTAFSYNPDPATAAAPQPARPRFGSAGDPVEGSEVDWERPRYWEDVRAGTALEPIAYPLSVYRLVMAAGSNRDFNSIHHNSEWAQATGAPEMYANVVFLQGMWERCVREFIGVYGTIRTLSGFRMGSFNTVGDTVVVRGTVERTWLDGDAAKVGYAEVRMWSSNKNGVSVGPGSVTVTLPRRGSDRHIDA